MFRNATRVVTLFVPLLVVLFVVNAEAGQGGSWARASSRWTPQTNASSVVMTGNTSWGTSATTATLHVDGVRNNGAATSGPLRLVLFYSPSKYPTATGTNAAIYTFGPLAAGATQSNVGGTVPFNPPSGCSYTAMLLQEQISGVWETGDSVTYISMCGFSPNHGPAAGGTEVTVTGKDLARVTTVTFGGTAGAISSKTETQIKVTSPPHSPGGVTFKLSDGSGYTSDTFTYDSNAPQISSLTPTHGPAAGGNNVTIAGSYLDSVTTVKFDGTSAAIVSKTASQIVATAPAHAAGSIQVRVDAPGGFATKAYVYDSLPKPDLQKISPTSGPAAGGQTVTLTGHDFDTVTSVRFGNTSATIKSQNASTIVVTTPPHDPGTVSVQVRSPNGTDSKDYVYENPAGELRLLPVVGSLAGNSGSFFRTSLQLTNPGSAPLSGKIVFHRQGQSPSPSDPFLDYSLASGASSVIPDVLPAMNTSGIGSLDLQAAPGAVVPVSLARIFNDGGTAGTTGMTIGMVASGDAPSAGQSAVLLSPPDIVAFRYNIGVRALTDVTMDVIVRNAAGATIRTTPQQFASGSFTQVSAATIAGGTLAPNDSLTFAVSSGSALIYGATTDNITQDPSYQAARIVPLDGDDPMFIPVVGSAAGNFGSFFRTAMQLYNPLTRAIQVRLLFHPQGQNGKDSDPSATFSLEPGETRYFSDVVAALGTSGLGSLDILSLSDARPVAVTRIYNDAGAKGTTGMTLEAMTDGEAVGNGDTAILIAPASPADFRYNIGVRTLGESTTLQFVVRDAAGATRKTVEVSYGSDYFTQVRASDLLGMDLGASDTLSITAKTGAAFLYGATTDNRTQDPSVQLAEKR